MNKPAQCGGPFGRRFLLVLTLVLFLTALGTPALVSAQSTAWTGTTGDWGNAANWSNGVPSSSVDAEVTIASTPTVTAMGEECRNLTLAVGIAGATIKVNSGSLGIGDLLLLSSNAIGTMSQYAGTVSAARAVIGDPERGTYTMFGGTMTLGTARVGSSGAGTSGSFIMTTGSPSCTISDSLHVQKAGSFQCGAGTLNVGSVPSDEVLIDGAFSLSNNPTISMTKFTMSGQAILSVAVGQLGVGTIMVSGTATLAGQIQVLDVLAPDGSYEVLRGNPLQGTFSLAFLPPNWSWKVEGNSLYVVKGMVPAATESWGRVKSSFHR